MLDGEAELGASPMEALLAALGGCMGIDVVDILQKGRQDVTAATLSLFGERPERPPRRFTTVTLRIVLEGRGLSRQKAERAVELSRTTYCSVWNSMAPDIDLRTEIEVRESS
jgi:putative redox protein